MIDTKAKAITILKSLLENENDQYTFGEINDSAEFLVIDEDNKSELVEESIFELRWDDGHRMSTNKVEYKYAVKLITDSLEARYNSANRLIGFIKGYNNDWSL